MHHNWIMTWALAALLLACGSATADDPAQSAVKVQAAPKRSLVLKVPAAGKAQVPPKPASGKSSKKKSELPPFTSAREKAALQFVQQHHPELGTVIERLKDVNREQYEQAIRELSAEADRLAHVKSMDEAMYAMLLEGWKLSSRIDVLTARLSCAEDDDDRLKDQLQKMVLQRFNWERSMVENRVQRLQESLEKAEASLRWFDENRERITQRRFQMLLRSARPEKNAPPNKKTQPGKSASSGKEKAE